MRRTYQTPETKVMTYKAATMLVIGVHLFAIGGYALYEHMPKEKKTAKIQEEKGPYSDALQSAWPRATPIVLATPKKTEHKETITQRKKQPTLIVPKPTEYTLAGGDNFYTVSKKLGVSFNKLAEYNNIKDVRSLRVGQTIKVPKES